MGSRMKKTTLRPYVLSAIFALTALCSFNVVYASERQANTSAIAFKLGDQNIAGTLTVPDGVATPPIVLILHGMGGNRHGPRIRGSSQTLFGRTAHILAMKGIASLRISTGGRGGSEGAFVDMTLQRRIKEAIKAIDWIVHQEEFKASDIFILGHSQGAAIAVSSAAHEGLARQVKAVVLWAPQSNVLNAYRRIMGETIYQKGINAKPDEIVRWRGAGGVTRAFKREFFRGLAEVKPLDDVGKLDGRLLIVTGKRDRWSTTTAARVFDDRHHGKTTFLEFDVGHRMGAQAGASAVDQLVRATTEWLAGGR